MEVKTKKVPVTIERECTLVNEYNLYIVDNFMDECHDKHHLLWNIDDDEFAIGFGFFGYHNADDGDYYVYSTVDILPDKRTAMQAWLNLTKED